MTRFKAFLLVVVLGASLALVSSPASAHVCTVSGDVVGHKAWMLAQGIAADDQAGSSHSTIGDSCEGAVTGDNVSETLVIIQDHGFENITVVLVIFAALVAFSFGIAVLAIGVRKSLAKLKMLVRSA